MIIKQYKMVVPKSAPQGSTPADRIAEIYVMDLRITKGLHLDVIPAWAWT